MEKWLRPGVVQVAAARACSTDSALGLAFGGAGSSGHGPQTSPSDARRPHLASGGITEGGVTSASSCAETHRWGRKEGLRGCPRSCPLARGFAPAYITDLNNPARTRGWQSLFNKRAQRLYASDLHICRTLCVPQNTFGVAKCVPDEHILRKNQSPLDFSTAPPGLETAQVGESGRKHRDLKCMYALRNYVLSSRHAKSSRRGLRALGHRKTSRGV